MLPDISLLSNESALQLLGQFIDQATDLGNAEMASNALSLCDDLASRIKGVLEVELCYFRANAWSVIRHVKHQEESAVWLWDQDEILHEIYWLRYAIQNESFSELDPLRQAQILVNTGNILSHIGRPIEAIEYWKRALGTTPRFAMAMGNLGFGYETYAKLLYDKGHAVVMLKAAYDSLRAIEGGNTLWDNPEFNSVKQQMLDRALLISSHIDIKQTESISLDGFSLGKTKSEEKYRLWVLENFLFLNPLNDIGSHTIAAQDILHLPDMVTDLGDPPSLIGFYNQLKQEFVSARYSFWQGSLTAMSYKRHFSDNNVILVNTLDYPAYGVAIEQIKFAFRSAYSLFDKIAFFINEYWALGVPAEKISFHSVWSEKKNVGFSLRQEFLGYPNLCLRGLYWLSKEFSDKDRDHGVSLGKVMEPDADQLRTIRNHLEHRYLKVHDDIWGFAREHETRQFSDTLAYHLTLTELAEKTLRLLKRAREALIYLSLAIHQEEQLRTEKRPGIAMPMTLPRWE